MESAANRTCVCRPRPRATCLHAGRVRLWRRTLRFGTHPRQAGCARSTRGKPRGAGFPPPAESSRRTDSHSAEPRLRFGPRNRPGRASPQFGAPTRHFLAPGVRDRGIVGATQAVEQGDDQRRTLLDRQAEGFVKQVVHTSVHSIQSSTPAPASAAGAKARPALPAAAAQPQCAVELCRASRPALGSRPCGSATAAVVTLCVSVGAKRQGGLHRCDDLRRPA